MSIITATLVITSLLTSVRLAATLPPHRIYFPLILKAAPQTWPIPQPTPTPRVVSVDFPLESIGYAWHYTAPQGSSQTSGDVSEGGVSDDGQRWVFYCDVTLSPRYLWTASDMVMLGFKGYDERGQLLYENLDQHPADPSWVAPGDTTRIEWDAPAADVPRGMKGWWALLRWR